MKLSDHFTLEELTRSDTATRMSLDQMPPLAILDTLKNTAEQMELVRILLGNRPILISSGYRCKALNRLVGGSEKSAHLSGAAIDFTCPEFGTPQEVVKELAKSSMLSFDQLIYEGKWVHISFAYPRRREVLTANFAHGGVTYTKGVK